jgi:IS30 family transposase
MRLRALRIHFTKQQSDAMWGRWRAGESAAEIARSLERYTSSVYTHFLAKGGFPPPKPKPRADALTLAEREEISRGITRTDSFHIIATRLKRRVSTISREVARNGGRDEYRAADADERARARARRPKRCKLATHGRLRQVVARRLEQDWSPEQISCWLRLTFPKDRRMQVSHETIYRSLFIQARGVLKKELKAHLRTRRKLRVPKANRHTRTGGAFVDAVSISERPASVEDRAVPGHWEGDLIQGASFSYVATLVERSTRYVMLVKLPSKETNVVVAALKKHITKLPNELRRSLTWDRGGEMAAHKQFSVATNVPVYFCDPHSPWQRGTNENTNGLLRQYFRPNIDLRDFSQADLNAIARRLNERPRKTLGFQTPAAMLEALLH